MSELEKPNMRLRIRREASSFATWFRNNWRDRRMFRYGVVVLGGGFLLCLAAYIALTRNLPDVDALRDYEPPLPTVVRGSDGEIVHSYARDRRVQLQYGDFPKVLVNAFLAAEDKTFFSHSGIDAGGLVGAVIDYVAKLGSDRRAVGGSTITQQVAKNIYLSKEYSVTRKLREMILARRIEGVLSKQEILELYLNEIPLGRRSFGVQAASRTYFDKDVGDLALHEAAFLAILPKAPETYSREKFAAKAMIRRNYVLDQMARNNFITPQAAAAAKAQPLDLVKAVDRQGRADAGYFLEEVRRTLLDKYGETSEDGRNSVYGGGLWVRTSLNMKMQDAAREQFRRGLMRYNGNRPWSKPIAQIKFSDGPWASQLAASPYAINYQGWRVGVVVNRDRSGAKIGFSDGKVYPLGNVAPALKSGDVVVAAKVGNAYSLRDIPPVSGGFIAQDPQTGRVYAMQGGFESRLDAFNRATQAKRQPGSTVKPFVYATGLDNGFTPASEIPDKPYCYDQGATLGEKCFKNFDGEGGGVHTMRWGLEQSRNLMTVHIAMESGMPKVVKTMEDVGIGKFAPYPAFALGAGETTLSRMVAAYSALANDGRLIKPSLIDYIQDRTGKVIWKSDERECTGCNMPKWDGKPMPRFGLRGKQVMDPRTAYQTLHMLEGVVQRGTGAVLNNLNLPMFGKTGTSTKSRDVWFVGGTSDVIAGTYLGYDIPRSMGGYAQGGTVAAPIVRDFFQAIMSDIRAYPFVAPAGIHMIRIDRLSGKQVYDAWPTLEPKPAVIWEAFKPNTEPERATLRSQLESRRQAILDMLRKAKQAASDALKGEPKSQEREQRDFVEESGGIY